MKEFCGSFVYANHYPPAKGCNGNRLRLPSPHRDTLRAVLMLARRKYRGFGCSLMHSFYGRKAAHKSVRTAFFKLLKLDISRKSLQQELLTLVLALCRFCLWQYEDKDQRTDQKKSRIKQLWKNLKSGEIVSKFICR